MKQLINRLICLCKGHKWYVIRPYPTWERCEKCDKLRPRK